MRGSLEGWHANIGIKEDLSMAMLQKACLLGQQGLSDMSLAPVVKGFDFVKDKFNRDELSKTSHGNNSKTRSIKPFFFFVCRKSVT